MEKSRWQLIVAMGLVVLSAVFYFLHYLIFRDAHHIFLYLLGDVAFVFIEVLLVSLIIHELLNQREKRTRFEKLNMVIGIFFSEVGTKLLNFISARDPHLQERIEDLLAKEGWSEKTFSTLREHLNRHDYRLAEIQREGLSQLKALLREKRDFLLRLLENPNILEHESFTSVLRAVFHLAEELDYREDFESLPHSDRTHLAGDIGRVYKFLAHQWLFYMQYLERNHPYLFSLSIRMNPFDRNASPIVKES
ncbi:MAG TPA: hypothetical protein VLK23_14055 [Thermodesulfobacteriota bacterium]|nr:hypothetical protein [Thermodesulfobacteriota bacterium]